MLIEIQCDEFKSRGKPRGPIRFHEGLNTIFGGTTAENSIGKSTFLMIVDYVFAGNTYSTSDAANTLNNHVINFTFRFDKEYYFSRDVVHSNVVNICNENYEVFDEMELDEYKQFLFKNYDINLPSISFRDVVGRYIRVATKGNDNPKKPLHAVQSESAAKAITALEKLFDSYARLEVYKQVEKEAKAKKKAYRDAREYGVVTYATRSKKQYNENEKEIDRLNQELDSLIAEEDSNITDEDLKQSDTVVALKDQITFIKRKRRSLSSQLNIVKFNLEGGMVPTSADINDLAEFFPDINIRRIGEIEFFHGKMQKILTSEFALEADRLKALIKMADSEIRNLEDQLRKIGKLANLSKSFLDKHNEIKRKISALGAANQYYDDVSAQSEAVKMATENLRQSEDAELRKIEAEINSEIVRKNDYIYDGKKTSPVLDLKDGKNYSFETPNDTGTGTAYKSLIIFDLSVLKLTKLPVVVHDSLIFKNVADEPIDQIMKLYLSSKKQIFIAFDKSIAYPEGTQAILDKTTVLKLNTDGEQLFGWGWDQKDSEGDK
ncbi:MAG: DUF2326 domain-containing protein [Firmicutes bacterium]|nr:DUF2326 domain-containing protein [Bacillota bacterium]